MSPGLDDEALSEVVGFVLILALVMAAISLYITYVVPAQGREDEIQKMGEVRDWFVNYKTQVDTLWMNSPPTVPFRYIRYQDALNPVIVDREGLFSTTSGGTTLSQVLDPATGSGTTPARMFIPILAPIRSSARISLPNYSETFTINATSTTGSDSMTVGMQGLEFQSQNNYWIQQTYTYLNGGVFLVQNATGDPISPTSADISVLAYPPIAIINATRPEAALSPEVNIVLINMTGTEEGALGTSSPVMVRTWLNDPPNYMIANRTFSKITLTAHTRSQPYAQMWADTFNNSVRNGITNTTTTPPGPQATITNNDASITIDAPPNSYVNLTVSQANYTAHLQNVQSMME
jgi:hypothetical protein